MENKNDIVRNENWIDVVVICSYLIKYVGYIEWGFVSFSPALTPLHWKFDKYWLSFEMHTSVM